MKTKLRRTLDRYVKYSNTRCVETDLGVRQFLDHENGISEPNALSRIIYAC